MPTIRLRQSMVAFCDSLSPSNLSTFHEMQLMGELDTSLKNAQTYRWRMTDDNPIMSCR